jgi:hypothetical protein
LSKPLSPARLPWLAPVQARQPEGVCDDTNFVAEGGEHFASHFELSCLTLCPLLSGFSQAMVSSRGVSGGGFGQARVAASRRCASASSASTIFSAETRRSLLTRPILDIIQMIHLVGSICQSFTPFR